MCKNVLNDFIDSNENQYKWLVGRHILNRTIVGYSFQDTYQLDTYVISRRIPRL